MSVMPVSVRVPSAERNVYTLTARAGDGGGAVRHCCRGARTVTNCRKALSSVLFRVRDCDLCVYDVQDMTLGQSVSQSVYYSDTDTMK